MKKIKFEKKLDLKKETIIAFNQKQMNNIHGGKVKPANNPTVNPGYTPSSGCFSYDTICL